MSGRGLGRCAGATVDETAGQAGPGFGAGRGAGRGRGLGRQWRGGGRGRGRCWQVAGPTAEPQVREELTDAGELQQLRQLAQALGERLEQLEARLASSTPADSEKNG